jgi:predicted methyltransferase
MAGRGTRGEAQSTDRSGMVFCRKLRDTDPAPRSVCGDITPGRKLMLNRRLIPLALMSAAALAAPLIAKPTMHRATAHKPKVAMPVDYSAMLADPLRSDDMRKLDEGRMPASVLAFAGIKPGQTVLDFIAGGGYYSLLLARAVGPTGKVIAANPPGEYNAKAWEPFAGKVPQMHVMVSEISAMKFAPHSLDLIFTNLNYHDLYWESEKYKFPRVEVPPVLAGWFAAVKRGGHVVIIDHVGPAGGDPREVAARLHRIDPERVKADMKAAGFVLEAESSVLRRSEDDHSKLVFDPAVRGKTDRFMLKFRRP